MSNYNKNILSYGMKIKNTVNKPAAVIMNPLKEDAVVVSHNMLHPSDQSCYHVPASQWHVEARFCVTFDSDHT